MRVERAIRGRSARGASNQAGLIAVDRVGAAAVSLGSGQTVHWALPGADQRGDELYNITFETDILIDAPGRYRFGASLAGAEGRLVLLGLKDGPRELRIGGAANREPREGDGALHLWHGELTDWLRLPAGAVTVQVRVAMIVGPDGGVGEGVTLESVWEMERDGLAGFAREPIPIEATRVPKYALTFAEQADRSQRGRDAIHRFGCVNCHTTGNETLDGMYRHEGPLLDAAADRASAAWMRRWITDPAAAHPRSAMPDVLPDDQRGRHDAEAIVHFLLSTARDPRGGAARPWRAVTPDADTVEAGRIMYERTGCVACHGTIDPGESGGFTPIAPFGDSKGKWEATGLAEFLLDPVAAHPSGRMPGMLLSADEATAITAYLLNHWEQASEDDWGVEVDGAMAGRGAAAFAARGCADCHGFKRNAAGAITRLQSTLHARPMASLRAGKGCMDPSDKASPRFVMTAGERADIEAAMEELSRVGQVASVSPVERARDRIRFLGCVACHESDGTGGIHLDVAHLFVSHGAGDLGDEGRLPPRLTGAGGKLRTEWLKDVLLGTGPEQGRARPYMSARMPRFGEENVGHLAEDLARVCGVPPEDDFTVWSPPDGFAEAGHALMGVDALNCVSCHAFGGASMDGAAAGPDIAAFSRRLRSSWWVPYIQDPARFKPGTRMTNFYLGGLGQRTDVLGGDPVKQAEAMWAYFLLGRDAPTPAGVTREP